MRRLGALLALTLGASACLTPVAEGDFEPDAGGSPALDAGTGAPDSGLPDAGHAVDFSATSSPSCAPNDGPATHLDFAAGSVAACGSSAAAFTVDLWTWTLMSKSYQLGAGLSADGAGWSCSALECFEVTSGTVLIESVSDDAVAGTVSLHLSNGETRAGRFRASRCGADAGVVPPMCG